METIDDKDLITNSELIPTGDLPALEKKIEASLQAYDRLLKMTVSRTLPSDWVDQQGVPYLMATGAERIARPWGIYVKDISFERESHTDARGDYFIYWCKGLVGSRLLDSELEFIGSCSSRDKFFGMVKGVLKPIEDINEPDIKKKSYTNMFINGVTRLLGLRRLDWKFLAECGIKKDQAMRVEYTGKGATDTISEPQAKMLYAKLKAKDLTDKEFCAYFEVKSIKELPKNKMNDALAWIDNPGPKERQPGEDDDIPY